MLFWYLDIMGKVHPHKATSIKQAFQEIIPAGSYEMNKIERPRCGTCRQPLPPPRERAPFVRWLHQWPIRIAEEWVVYMIFSDSDDQQFWSINFLGTRIFIESGNFEFRNLNTSQDSFRQCVRGPVIFFKHHNLSRLPSRTMDYEAKDFYRDWPTFFQEEGTQPYHHLEKKLYTTAPENVLHDLLQVEMGNKQAIQTLFSAVTDEDRPLISSDQVNVYSWLLAIILRRISLSGWMPWSCCSSV